MRRFCLAPERRLNCPGHGSGSGVPSTWSVLITSSHPGHPGGCAPERGPQDTSSGLKATVTSELFRLTFPSVDDQGPGRGTGEGGQRSGG